MPVPRVPEMQGIHATGGNVPLVSLSTLYLHACQVRVTVGDSGILLLCLFYVVFRALINSLDC